MNIKKCLKKADNQTFDSISDQWNQLNKTRSLQLTKIIIKKIEMDKRELSLNWRGLQMDKKYNKIGKSLLYLALTLNYAKHGR